MGEIHGRIGYHIGAKRILIMNKRRIVYSILAVLFGVFMVIYGGMDDSPGGQLLGLLMVALGIVGVIKSRKQNSD